MAACITGSQRANLPCVQLFLLKQTAIFCAFYSITHTHTHTHSKQPPFTVRQFVWRSPFSILLSFYARPTNTSSYTQRKFVLLRLISITDLAELHSFFLIIIAACPTTSSPASTRPFFCSRPKAISLASNYPPDMAVHWTTSCSLLPSKWALEHWAFGCLNALEANTWRSSKASPWFRESIPFDT